MTAAATPVLAAEGLAKRYGRRRALDGVSFTLGHGECLALFGPNGAGKTTLLRILAGLLKPSRGTAEVDGVAVRGDPAARARVGLISHQSLLYTVLTARENVEFSARLYGLADPRGAAERALARLRILERADQPVRALSRGMQQRVSIARAIVHEPSVVLLDEPYTGLDEAGAAALTAVLAALKDRGAGLVLVTHHLAEGLAMATHAAVMRAGRFARLERRDGLDVARYAAEYRELVTAGA
ncbi:MAG TPA: heme ABC exporter ATP-binding protein CcmA [Gemmatimonadaceae bacterium]|jgi:heme exporter protein A